MLLTAAAADCCRQQKNAAEMATEVHASQLMPMSTLIDIDGIACISVDVDIDVDAYVDVHADVDVDADVHVDSLQCRWRCS